MSSLSESQIPQITHLGSLETTANLQGMTAYLEQVHPELTQMLQERGLSIPFTVIGENTRIKPHLAAGLAAINANLVGFVHDLSTVLRPLDITIIPYQFPTGLRSKVALMFRHAQVVVTTRAAVAGMPETINDHNCIMVDELTEFPEKLVELIQDTELRKRLACNARQTFEQDFTIDGQLDKYEAVLRFLNN